MPDSTSGLVRSPHPSNGAYAFAIQITAPIIRDEQFTIVQEWHKGVT